MALSQKKRFSLSPILSPTKNSTLLSSYFSSQEKHEDKLPTADDVRKAIDNLERLVLAADAYRDLVNKLSKASKTLSKALKDYGNSKGMENVHVMCFHTTSQFYDNHNEIQSKLNKALQKDFEAIQKFWDKYSKKVAKEEKAHNDYVGDLDKQLKKMSKDYEKKTKKDSKSSMETHNQYMTSFTAVGSDIARAQKEYAEKVAKREKRTHSIISQIVCKLAEGHFAYFNESLKKCGPNITKMKEWAPFAGEDMPPPQDFDGFLEDQSLSDVNSTTSERKTISIASISEKQVAAMNFSSQETKLQFSEEPENIITTKYVQIPEPKFPVITTPETTKPTYTRPLSLTFDNINIHNKKNDENSSYNLSPTTSSNPSTPIVQPTPAFPVTSPMQPLNSKSSDLISKVSIGIHDEDVIFLREEKEVQPPEVFMESKVEKNVLNQPFGFINKISQSKNIEEKNNNVTNDIKKDDEEVENFDEKDEKFDDEKDIISVRDEKQPEKKSDLISTTLSSFHHRDNASDDSNSTLNDYNKNNENSNEKLKIDEKNETPPPLPEKPNEMKSTIKLITKDQEKEITNKRSSTIKNPSIDKNFKPSLNVNDDNSLNESIHEPSPQILSEKPRFIPGEFPFKNKGISGISSNTLNSSPPPQSLMQAPKQVDYSCEDNDYREEYPRRYEEDTEYYETDQGLYNNNINNNINNNMNRYSNSRDHRDENLHYNPSFRGERMRYNDTNLNYHRTQKYVDDGYETYDYAPSQSHGSYIRDRSPPRNSPSYSPRPYSNAPAPLNHGSSVREITSRFQSMGEERRSLTPPTRNVPIPTSGRVSEMTSRFGDRRSKRNDVVINPPHMSNSRDRDYGYNEPIEYRDDRVDRVYIQYDDDDLIHDRHCNCRNCRLAEDNMINSNRLPIRHNNPAPFNPRTDSNFLKNYNR